MNTMKSPESGVCSAVNLRHGGENERSCLKPTGNPVIISNLPLKCILDTKCNETEIRILKKESEIYISENNSAPERQISLESEATDAVKIEENKILLATESGLVTIYRENGEWKKKSDEEFPAVTIYSDQSTVIISSSISSAKLKDSDGAKGIWLGREDRKSLTKDIISAHDDILNQAKKMQRLTQPVLARYKLYGNNDELIFKSPVVLLTVPEKIYQFREPITVEMNDGYTERQGFTVQAASYQPRFRISSHKSRTDVAYMIIEMSTPFEQIDRNLLSVCALNTDKNGRRYITATMPGVFETDNAADSIIDTLNDYEKALKPCTRVEKPFSNGMPYSSPITKVYGEKGVKTVKDNSEVLSDLSLPHSFVARRVCVNGNNLLMGDIIRKRYKGYNILIMCSHDIGNSDWKCVISVSFRNSTEKVVRMDSGNTWNPISIGPLIGYPSQEAVSMTINLQCGTKKYRRTFPLKASVNGNMAYYLSENLKPITFEGFETDTFLVPMENIVNKVYSGTVICSKTSAPKMPICINKVCEDKITEISTAIAAQSGWDQSRCRFYIFTDTSTYAATFTNSQKLQAVNKISNFGLASNECGTYIPALGYYYVNSGKLIRLTGVKAEIITKTDAKKVCYDSIHNELWIIGNKTFVYELSHNSFYERKLTDKILYVNSGYATTSSSTIDISNENNNSLIEIEWRDRFESKGASRARLKNVKAKKIRVLRSIYADITSAAVESLNIELRADHGAGLANSRLLYRSTHNGSINSPILLYTPFTLQDGYFITISGNVSSDTEIHDVTVNIRQ